jgi:hypothetical protein
LGKGRLLDKLGKQMNNERLRSRPLMMEFDEEEEEEEETKKAGLELPEDTTETVPGLLERPSTPPTAKTNSYPGLKDSDKSQQLLPTSFNPHRRRPIRALYIYYT